MAPKTCRAKDERNKECSVHLVGPKLNIYITKMYGTTNIKKVYFSKPYSQSWAGIQLPSLHPAIRGTTTVTVY
jgi:hypothetical protein